MEVRSPADKGIRTAGERRSERHLTAFCTRDGKRLYSHAVFHPEPHPTGGELQGGMSVEREIVLTPEGYRRLKDEINYLSTKRRDEVADRIRDSRQFGDISENAEYDDAKNEQAMLEQRIAGLEEKLRSAKIIEAGDVKTESVGVGTRVTLQNVQNGDMIQYHIVGSAEADPSDHRLSNESPVGRAIMGRRPGDVVNVVVPKGTTKLKIITIERA